MKKRIAILPGDGSGPEVIEQAVKVLDAIGDRFNHHFEYCYAEAGSRANQRYGSFFPETTISTCLQANAVLAGPLASAAAAYSPQEFSGINSAIGQFAQYLPLRYYTSTDHLSLLKHNQALDADNLIINGYEAHLSDQKAVDRFCRYIFVIAGRRKKSVVFAKSGSLRTDPDRWQTSLTPLYARFPEIKVSFAEPAKIARQLLSRQLKSDIIVTLDESGHMLHTFANKLYGTTGLTPKILIGQKQSIFQAAHETLSNDQAGEDTANPFAMLYAGALLLAHLNLHRESILVEQVVQHILEKGIGTNDLSPNYVYSCSQIGDIAAHLISEGDDYGLRQERIHARMSTII